jgi:hypothetical protein
LNRESLWRSRGANSGRYNEASIKVPSAELPKAAFEIARAQEGNRFEGKENLVDLTGGLN